MSESNLKSNWEFVNKNKDSLLKEYHDKYLLVFEKKIINSFDTYASAANEGVRLFGIEGNFLVYYLTEEEPFNFVIGAAL